MCRALLSGLLFGLTSALVLPLATADFAQPDTYAVVIGISQYREEEIPKVAYAVKDAEAVARLLETQAGIPKSHIRFMPDAKATIGDLRTIGDWLRMRVKPESTVYVYYAGHGTPDQKTGEAYLVPWDGHPDYPTGLYPLKELYVTLNALPSKNILVWLDSCFSGAAGRSVLAKGARPMALTVENPVLASGKLVVLAASSGTQISSDYDKVGHGLFTYALLTGLHGAADTDHDGTVTLKELFPYVRDRVAQTAVDELNRVQTPVLFPSLESLGQRASLPLWKLHEPSKPLPRQKSYDQLLYKQLLGFEGSHRYKEIFMFDVFDVSNFHVSKLRGLVHKVVEEHAEIEDLKGMRVPGKRTPFHEWVFDPRGNIVKEEDYVGNVTSLITYDDQDNIVKIDRTDQPFCETEETRRLLDQKKNLADCSSRERAIYLFDAKGNITEETVVKPDGSLKSRRAWSYDREGKITETTWYDGKGAITMKKLHVYSVRGPIMTEKIYLTRTLLDQLIEHSELIQPSEQIQHEFDEKGNKISEYHTAAEYQRSTATGTKRQVPISKDLYSYDLMGNLTKREHIFWIGEGEGYIAQLKKVYDGADRIIEEISYKKDGSISEHFSINYRADGKIEQEIIFAADGSIKDKHAYIYDARGLLLKIESESGDVGIRFTYDKHGNPTQWETEDVVLRFDYQYDAHGNWVKLEPLFSVNEGGKPVYKKGDVRYRTITYF